MHAECFAALQMGALRELERTSSRNNSTKSLPASEQIKALWSTKYSLARHLCRCACGQGFLRPVFGSNRANVLRVGDDAETADPAADEKKARLEAQLAKQREREVQERARTKADTETGCVPPPS